MDDPKQRLFGFPDAERLTATGLDGWYLVEASSPRYRTVMSWGRRGPVATSVLRDDAELIVTEHNGRLLAEAELARQERPR